jgi:hypothetical protein
MIKSEIRINEPNTNDIYDLLKSGEDKNKTFLELKKKINIDSADQLGLTVLHRAVINQDLETVKFLLQTAKVNPNIKDIYGFTALHYASRFEEPTNLSRPEIPGDAVNAESAKSNPSIVEHLLIAGSNVDAVDNEGQTPLYIASENNNIKAIKSLLIVATNSNIPSKYNPKHFSEIFSESDHKLLSNVKEFFKQSVIKVPATSKLEVKKEEDLRAIEVSSNPSSNIPGIFHFTTIEEDGKRKLKSVQATRGMPDVNDSLAYETKPEITGNLSPTDLKGSTPFSMMGSQNLGPSQMDKHESLNEGDKNKFKRITPSRVNSSGPRLSSDDEATKTRRPQDITTGFNPHETGRHYFDPTTLQEEKEPRRSGIKMLTPQGNAKVGPRSLGESR